MKRSSNSSPALRPVGRLHQHSAFRDVPAAQIELVIAHPADGFRGKRDPGVRRFSSSRRRENILGDGEEGLDHRRVNWRLTGGNFARRLVKESASDTAGPTSWRPAYPQQRRCARPVGYGYPAVPRVAEPSNRSWWVSRISAAGNAARCGLISVVPDPGRGCASRSIPPRSASPSE